MSTTALICIILLKKLCNHPELIYETIMKPRERENPKNNNNNNTNINKEKKKKKKNKDEEEEEEEIDIIDEVDENEYDDNIQKLHFAKTNLLSYFPEKYSLLDYQPKLSGLSAEKRKKKDSLTHLEERVI
jgi:hypothetical protein